MTLLYPSKPLHYAPKSIHKTSDMTYKITLTTSGHTFEAEENECVLDAALKAGFSLPYGCRNGACGSCLGTLVNGEVRYDDRNRSALNEEREQAGGMLTCQAIACSDLTIEAKELTSSREIEVKRLPARVEEKNQLSHDVIEIKLKLPETERLQFLPGQYIDILLKDGKPRAFSLANPPHRDDYLELHIRVVEGGSFTNFVQDEMKVKDLLRVEGPHGSFTLDEDSKRPVLLIAGGTGFAPIQSILEHAIADGDQRQFHVYWGVRTEEDLYLNERARQWANDHANIVFIPVLSEHDPSLPWSGMTGFVHEAVLENHRNLADYDAYMAGPPAMVEAARTGFLAAGMPEDQMFSDAFEFSTPSKSE
jgi:CDP-4-dehydro-6-deoxyglucose reductase